MPLRSQSLDNSIRHRLLAFPAFGRVAISVAVDAPCVPVFLNKWCFGVERIATLRTEKVASVPLRTTSNYYLALNRRFAALAPRTEELVEVEMAIKPQSFVSIFVCSLSYSFLDIMTGHTSTNTVQALIAEVLWFWVKSYAFEPLAAVVAAEAFVMEACSTSRDDTTGDWLNTVAAQSSRSTYRSWRETRIVANAGHWCSCSMVRRRPNWCLGRCWEWSDWAIDRDCRWCGH